MNSFSLMKLSRALERAIEEGLEPKSLVDLLARLIDVGGDEGDAEALADAIALSTSIEEKTAARDACLVLYLRSNAWSSLQGLRHDGLDAWAWEQPELLSQIYWLRAAIQHEGFNDLSTGRKSQIFCNLGNALSYLGRIVEAIVEWRNALLALPIHGMARGNLGGGLFRYGMALYDDGHTYWLLRGAKDELINAIEGGVGRDGSTYPEALEGFAHFLQHVEERLDEYDDDGAGEKQEEWHLGQTEKEKQYRRWCLAKTLFLNPLNDLSAATVGAADVLLLPPHRINGAGITYRAFYNQLKQEYIYARWCLFEGVTANEVHFADRDVYLESNADLALYSMGLEQIKTTFRCAYSLLDKVAYFINAYWKAGWPEKKVNFRNVWYEEKKPRGAPSIPLRPVFETSKNPPLRGLFWLSKDVYLTHLQDVADPSAKESDALRNHMEHKFMKVVDTILKNDCSSDIFEDQLAHLVQRDELIARSEHLLKLSRAALIYLSLAMHYEERRRPPPDGPIVPVDLGSYSDDLKV
jgi:hypothetical protein